MAADLTDGMQLETLEVSYPKLSVGVDNDVVTIGAATVTAADNKASNGVVHIIDTVLVPPNIVELAQATGDLSTLVQAVVAGELTDALSGAGPFTVFAPNNNAFSNIQAKVTELLKAENKAELVKVLKYHVVSGSNMAADLTDGMQLETLEGGKLSVSVGNDGVTIGAAKVAAADNKASNGVVHIIDAVLVPPESDSGSSKNIVQLAQATADLSTLVSALSQADLTETLSEAGPFTVFAPTADAFAKIQSTVDDLLKAENKAELVKVLKYHVVSGSKMAADLTDGMQLATLEGGKLLVSVGSDGVKIGAAKVTAADNKASNGVVHIIDAVLVPPGAGSTGGSSTNGTAEVDVACRAGALFAVVTCSWLFV